VSHVADPKDVRTSSFRCIPAIVTCKTLLLDEVAAGRIAVFKHFADKIVQQLLQESVIILLKADLSKEGLTTGDENKKPESIIVFFLQILSVEFFVRRGLIHIVLICFNGILTLLTWFSL